MERALNYSLDNLQKKAGQIQTALDRLEVIPSELGQTDQPSFVKEPRAAFQRLNRNNFAELPPLERIHRVRRLNEIRDRIADVTTPILKTKKEEIDSQISERIRIVEELVKNEPAVLEARRSLSRLVDSPRVLKEEIDMVKEAVDEIERGTRLRLFKEPLSTLQPKQPSQAPRNNVEEKLAVPEKEIPKIETYVVTFPDGKEIRTTSLKSKLLLEALCKKPLTLREQIIAVYGEDETVSQVDASNLLYRTNRLLISIGKRITQPNSPKGNERTQGIQRPYVILELETQMPEIVINAETQEASINGKKINLKNQAVRTIFFALAQNASGSISGHTLLEKAKETGYSGKYVSDLIKQLRSLIGDTSNKPQFIVTYSGNRLLSYGLNAQVKYTKDEIKKAPKIVRPEQPRENRRVVYALKPLIPERLIALEAIITNPDISKAEVINLLGTNGKGEPITNLSRMRNSLINAANLLATKNYHYIQAANNQEEEIWNRIVEKLGTTDYAAAREILVDKIKTWVGIKKGSVEIKPKVTQTPVENLQHEIAIIQKQMIEMRTLVTQGGLDASFLNDTRKSLEAKQRELDILTGRITPAAASKEIKPDLSPDLRTDLTEIINKTEKANEKKNGWDKVSIMIHLNMSGDDIRSIISTGLIRIGVNAKSFPKDLILTDQEVALIEYLSKQNSPLTPEIANYARAGISTILQERQIKN